MVENAERKSQPDYGFRAIISLVVVIAFWLLLMPVVPSIANTAMRRFHLVNRSFLAFAVQFPIPAMYNFSNRCEVTEIPPGLVDPLFLDPLLDLSETPTALRHINHFPARTVTFSSGRHRHLWAREDRWLRMESRYRGQTLETQFHLRRREDGGFDLVRLDAP